jgi:hypothetical protein
MRSGSSTRRARVGVLTLIGAVGAAAFVALGYASSQTPAQAQYAPTNTKAPSISDKKPQQGEVLTADPGTWNSDGPVSFTFQWLRCDDKGNKCVGIPSATQQKYTVQGADVGNTLRVTVTATNASGTSAPATSDKTDPVKAAPAPPPPPPPGSTIPVTAVTAPERLVAAEVGFSPNPIRRQTPSIDVRVRVKDTRGFLVSGALVFVRSTPLVTTSSGEATSGNDGWATVRLHPRRNYGIIRFQDNLQIFVRVRKAGDPLFAGVSGRQLVQVRIAH